VAFGAAKIEEGEVGFFFSQCVGVDAENGIEQPVLL
jgi:hypothetical protein